MNYELRSSLERVASRLRRRSLWASLAWCGLAWGLVALALAPTGPYPMGLVALLAGLAVASSLGLAWRASAGDRDPRRVAGRIEAALPDLDAGLLTAIEADADGGPRNYLRQAVVDRAVEHGREHDWEGAVVPSGRLVGARLAGIVGVGLATAAFGLLAHQARQLVGSSTTFGPRGLAATGLEVTPGNAEIERGTPLLVVARFGAGAPAEAKLVVEGAEPRSMTRSLEDPAFAGRVETVDADLTYHVAFGDGRSPSYRVKVYEHPELTRVDAALDFPTYTGLEPKVAEDVRHVSAVEGTNADLTFRLNKPVVSAALVDEAGVETPLVVPAAPSGDEPPALRAAMALAESHKYKLKLVDRDGRANKLPADLAVNVSKNKPADVAFAAPAHDVRVSPIEELKLKAKAQDDFGVVRYGVSYALAGAEPREIVLSSAEKPAMPVRKAEADHLIDFESLKAAPDELLSYFAWAEDVGPDGSVRRAEGDMYFAEVRHFEEIFRQGEQPSQQQQQQQQQGGQQQQAEQLAELQKQVVNGNWKVIRRETDSKPSAGFAEDVKTLKEAQQQAVDQAATVGERLQDETSKKHLEAAVKAMGQAVDRLAAAGAASDPAALKPALASEQAAYQALLKLRAREFQVVRGRQQRNLGRQSGSSQSQRQLNQLELTEEENRFEERSQASAQETSEQEQQRREASQVASRLRELSRRQADLDARLKELQSALEAAKDEQARKEVERQLKRLRDEQKQILRDADEVRERMEQEQNRDRMADARQQVEQGRENLRRASEALDKGEIPQAITEGARAGEKLDKVREDLRKQSANRFADDLTEMRDRARKLDETQDRLTERLEGEQAQAGRSLRDTPDRKDVEQGLARQREDLEKLVDRMKATVEEAEEPEPLLAKSLYDAARDADRRDISRTLNEAERLTQLGVPEEAAKSSRRAGEGLDQLREGLERAARNVLGDEVAALKRAQEEVEDLADQVDREIAQADPDLAGRPPGEDEGQPRQGRGRRGGERQEGQHDQAQDQPGQGRREDQQDQAQQDRQEGQGQGEGQERQDRQQGQRGQGRRGQQQGQQPGQGPQQGQQGQQGQGEQEGEQPGQGEQQGQGQQEGQGRQQGQGQQQGQQGQGQQQGRGQQQGQGEQQGQQDAQGEQQGQGRQQGEGRQGGQQQGGQQQGGRGRSNGDRLMDAVAGGPGGNPNGPIRGEGYRQWADRMRDVEEILDDPELRAEAARIRDRVRGVREDYKRHAKEPDWTKLKEMVADPIRELRERITEEVRRREEPDAPVPIDRDPVPPRFAEGVRRYYERLGSGR